MAETWVVITNFNGDCSALDRPRKLQPVGVRVTLETHRGQSDREFASKRTVLTKSVLNMTRTRQMLKNLLITPMFHT